MTGLWKNKPDGYEAKDVMSGILFDRYNCWDGYCNHDKKKKKTF